MGDESRDSKAQRDRNIRRAQTSTGSQLEVQCARKAGGLGDRNVCPHKGIGMVLPLTPGPPHCHVLPRPVAGWSVCTQDPARYRTGVVMLLRSASHALAGFGRGSW